MTELENEIEPERGGFGRENAPEVAEVDRAGLALNAEKLGGLTRMRCALGEATELGERGRGRIVTLEIAAQQRAGVPDLGRHQLTGETQAKGRLEAPLILRCPQLDVLVAGTDGVAEKPAAVAHKRHRDLAPHQLVPAGRGDADVADQHEL